MIVRRNYNYRVVLAVVVALMLAMIGVVNAETISLNVKAGPCEIIKDRHGYDSVTIDGYKTRGAPGNPMLPSKVFNILVPPDIIWDSLELNIVDVDTGILPGTYEIRPAAPDAAYVDGKMVYDWGRSVNVVDGKNADVYGADAFFPTEYAKLVPYSEMRKWKYTKVYFSPIQYNPVTGKLKLIKNIKIEISFQRSGDRASPALLRDKVMDCLAPELFHNYTQGKGWYVLPDGPEQDGTEMFNDSNSWKDGDLPLKVIDQPSVTYNYVIITTNAAVSGSSKLSSFISHKQARGHSVLVVTETDFDGLAGQAPNHRAEKIRQWLINNYLTYGIEYVLLIGDPEPYESAGLGEDIPMKMCWPRRGAGSLEESPTDAFYADLTGNWDLDSNQYYGEWSDYTGSGGVDFAMEVWVGRIPVYSAAYSTLDNILQKIMDYENETTISWRESILLPMSFSDVGYDGAPLAEQMMDDYLDTRTSSYTQYQQGNGACSLNSTYPSDEELRGGTVVRDRWAANDYGIVCWWGHGSSTSASVGCDGCWDGTLFSYTQTSSLDDDHPSFTYLCSCNNAYPENSNNLAYSILKQGGIGTVSATRVSWFNIYVGYGDFDGSSTNSGIGYEYVERLTQPLAGGRALYEAKLAVTPDIGARNTRLMNQYDFNLYGDPTVGLDSSSPVGGCNPFSENFNDDVADNWVTDGSNRWAVISGVYRMTGSSPAINIARWTYYNSDSSDFTYQARVRKTSGSTSSSMGLYFRSSDGSITNNAYIFHINANGSYKYCKYVNGNFVYLSGWIFSSAIKADLNVWNTLKVVAQGTNFDLYCNGTLLTSFTDTSHSAGKVGLKAYDQSGYANVVEFDDVKLSCGGANMGATYLLLLGN